MVTASGHGSVSADIASDTAMVASDAVRPRVTLDLRQAHIDGRASVDAFALFGGAGGGCR